tara:strand:+ start:281 stop:502 length:222 start_codon:yes stop_codon:yes gene_type:complete
MITLENISTGEIVKGEELEYFVDDDTSIGEVYLDGDLIFQALDVIDDGQLEHAMKLDFTLTDIQVDIFSDFNQ